MTQTDALGKFSFHPLAAAYDYQLLCDSADYKLLGERPVLRATNDGALVQVEIAKVDSEIAGRVVDAAGQPVDDAAVWLLDSPFDQPQERSRWDGEFSMRVPSGTYQVQAHWANYDSACGAGKRAGARACVAVAGFGPRGGFGRSGYVCGGA